MSVLEKILGAYGPGHALEHGGKRYVFKAVDQKTKQALSAAYFERARRAVYEMRELASDRQYEGMLSRVADAYRRGEYDFPNGESFAYFMEAGASELVRHLTGCTQQDAEALCMERGIDVLSVVLCVVTASFPDVKKKMLEGGMVGEAALQKLAKVLEAAA